MAEGMAVANLGTVATDDVAAAADHVRQRASGGREAPLNGGPNEPRRFAIQRGHGARVDSPVERGCSRWVVVVAEAYDRGTSC
jgi:hypothetical protein